MLQLLQFDDDYGINDSLPCAPAELRSRLSPLVDNSVIALFKFVDDCGINAVFVIAPATIHQLRLEGLALCHPGGPVDACRLPRCSLGTNVKFANVPAATLNYNQTPPHGGLLNGPIDALAAAVALFYAVTDFTTAQNLMFIGLIVAAIANSVIFLLFSLEVLGIAATSAAMKDAPTMCAATLKELEQSYALSMRFLVASLWTPCLAASVDDLFSLQES